MLSWDQLEPIFKKVVPHYVSNRHDYWELVAEVWLLGRVQRLASMRYASHRVHKDCIDVMRRFDGRINRTKGVPSYGRGTARKRTRFKSLDQRRAGDGKDLSLKGLLDRFDPDRAEAKDQVDWILKGISNEQKLMIKLYAEGFTQMAIAKIVGVSDARVSQLNARTKRTVMKRLKTLSERNRGHVI